MGRRQILHQVEEKGLRVDRPYSRLLKTELIGDDHDAPDAVHDVVVDVGVQSAPVDAVTPTSSIEKVDVVAAPIDVTPVVDTAGHVDVVGVDQAASSAVQSSDVATVAIEPEKKQVRNALKELTDSKQPKARVGARKAKVPPASSDPSQEA